MELRLLNNTSRLLIGTLTLETGGSRRAPPAGIQILVWPTAAWKCVFRNFDYS